VKKIIFVPFLSVAVSICDSKIGNTNNDKKRHSELVSESHFKVNNVFIETLK